MRRFRSQPARSPAIATTKTVLRSRMARTQVRRGCLELRPIVVRTPKPRGGTRVNHGVCTALRRWPPPLVVVSLLRLWPGASGGEPGVRGGASAAVTVAPIDAPITTRKLPRADAAKQPARQSCPRATNPDLRDCESPGG